MWARRGIALLVLPQVSGRRGQADFVASDYPRAYICDECVAVCNSILEDDRGTDATHAAVAAGHLPRPEEVKSFLDDYVIGQDQTRNSSPWRSTSLQAHSDEQDAQQ